MKKAPCARLGMRISPKISEKPDDNRNKRPPKATLFSVWMIQNCHCIFRLLLGEASPAHHAVIAGLDTASRACPTCAAYKSGSRASPSSGAIHPSSKRWTPGSSPGVTGMARTNRELLLEVLRRRVVARIDRVLQELVLFIGPELAHIGIGLDHRVDIAPVLLLDLADIDVADDVAELVEPHRAAQGVRHFRLSQCLHERFFVFGLAVDRLERVLEHLAAEIGLRGIDARVDFVVAADRFDELLVDREIELGRIPIAGNGAERILAHLLQQRFVDGRKSAKDLHPVAVLAQLANELEAVRAGVPGIDRVEIGLEL